MLWLAFAFTTAFALATADTLSKKELSGSSADELVIAWVRDGYALPFLAVPLFFIQIPALDEYFWYSVLALLPLEVTAIILYIRAIKLSPLSLTIPFLALSPVFIVVIAFVFLGEWPSNGGLAGIILITSGAYVMNASASKEGIFGPIKAIAKEPGSILMIIVAFLYSITSTIGKIAIQHSSPLFFGFFYPFVLTLIFTVILLYKGRFRLVFSKPFTFARIGFFTAIMIGSHFVALGLTQVAYMISVKRTSLIMSVIYGKLFFGEEKIRERLAGSAIMLAGVMLIVFSS